MSEAALREQVRKRSWAAPGGAHDHVVRILKLALPAAIGMLLAFLALVPLAKDSDISFILDKNKVEVAKERMRVSSARYRGQDDRGRAFSVDASSAVQKSSREPVVDIAGMSARLALDDGPASLKADAARYNMDTQSVQVIGPILFSTTDGYRLETSDVTVDLATRRLTGHNGVEGRMPLGRFSAQNVAADLGERRVVLTGRARLHIDQGGVQ